jgi:hypothetical protein
MISGQQHEYKRPDLAIVIMIRAGPEQDYFLP